MSEPWTHHFEVFMTVDGLSRESIDFVMPVWTPGSYLVREFARNVQEFSAQDGNGNGLVWEKVNKNTWRVTSKNATRVVVRYRVYAFELSVRTSFLNDTHAFINGAGVFMYVDGFVHLPYRVKISPYNGWERISTTLEKVSGDGARFLAPDYDILVDSPIEIGNHRIVEFEFRGISHTIAICGEGNYDPEKLRADLCRIVEASVGIFDELPYRRYTFFLHLLPEGGGGLEHLNSCSIIASRWTFHPAESYRKFLALAAHEFFHVWNAKRIRPHSLGPFDYTRENYTRLLWVSEGFTDYYGYLLLRRSGLETPEQYLEGLSKRIQNYRETPGRLIETLADASFDAWIKHYRRDEHSPNATVSYYSKGELVGLLLDLELRYRTHGERSLDDVLRMLYQRFYKSLGRGFTDTEFQEVCEEVAGGSLRQFFNDYAYGTAELDFSRTLAYSGLTLARDSEDTSAPPKGFLGISMKFSEGKLLIAGVTSGTPAYDYGLNAHDEILALDGFRASPDTLGARIEEMAPGTRVDLTVSRHGVLRTILVVLGPKPVEMKIARLPSPTQNQTRFYESWLRSPWEKK